MLLLRWQLSKLSIRCNPASAHTASNTNYENIQTLFRDDPDAVSPKVYRYEYIPRRSVSGEIVGYVIQATPARRDCDFHRSFTITDDGRVFWTLEPRAATVSDILYR